MDICQHSLFRLLLFYLSICPSLSSILPHNNEENLIVTEEEKRALKSNSKNSTFQKKLSKHPIFIIISFDGFRYDYFSKANTPTLDSIKSNGVHSAYMKNEFPTKTFPNHHSVATGLHPESHGVVENSFYDPILTKKLYVNDEEYWNYNRDVLPLWILNELGGDNRTSGVMMWPGGNVAYGHNSTKSTFSMNWDTQVPFSSRVDTVLSWLTHPKTPANLVFLYFEEPDEVGHGFGTESPHVVEQIQALENVTSYLVDKLEEMGITDNVNLVFVSDHGFSSVRQENIINITSLVEMDKVEFYGGTPTQFIFPKDEKDTDVIYESLKTHSSGLNFSVYKKSELREKVPDWHYSDNPRIPPILALADLGYVFDDFYKSIDFYNKKYNRTPSLSNVYGMHGYDNRLLAMHPFFMARGPLFRIGVEVEPFHNIDLFPLLCHLLKIETPPNNGSLPHVEQLLFRHGFHMGSPVGWAVAGAILVGMLILFVIMSFLIRHQKSPSSRSFSHEPSVEYRTLSSNDPYTHNLSTNGKSMRWEEEGLLNAFDSDDSSSSDELVLFADAKSASRKSIDSKS